MSNSESVLSYLSAEEVLRDSDEIVLSIGRSGKIILSSIHGSHILGCSREETAGMNWFSDFVPETVREEVLEEFRSCLGRAEEAEFRQEYPVICRDGSEKAASWLNRVVRDEDGIVMCVLLSGHRKEAPPEPPDKLEEDRDTLESLKRSEEKYRTLVERSNDSIIIHRDGVIVFANRTAMELTGYGIEELIGNSFLNFVSSEFEALVLRNMTNRISGKDVPSIYNIELLGKNGETIPVEVNVSGLDYDGERAWMIFIRDLSERQVLEGQLKQAQKMEAVGQLAGGMAHDFNNILQVINGYTELAETVLEDDHPVRDMIQQISDASGRAGELVKQLLLFSRNKVIVTSVMDLNQIISEHLSMLERITGENITMRFTPSSEPVYVNADHSMMGQILLNICLNSTDAMPEGGEITVSTERVYLNSEFCETNPSARPGYYGMLTVSDTGHGIDPEILDRIFEPFFSTKGIAAGTGLGLSSVYGIVTQHDGLIIAGNQPDGGACFSIYLPVADRNIEIEEIPKEYELEETASLTVVIAEDDESVRNLACEVLAEAGHEVITAGDGEEAVVLVTDSPDSVDLVILDAAMPVMDGFTAAEKIREVCPEMPIIFCSGYTSEQNTDGLNRFRERSRFLVKPYSMSHLLTAIKELFSGNIHNREGT
ncbi:MAG: PAS domain S-box protein [Candidatus Aegiribacteria sp.]